VIEADPTRRDHRNFGLESGGTRIVLDTGKEVWVEAWPEDVAKAIADAQKEAS
jgi:hypothetical protein